MGPSNDIAKIVAEAIDDLNDSKYESATNICIPNYNQHCFGTFKCSDDQANHSNVNEAEHSTDDDGVYSDVGEKISVYQSEDKEYHLGKVSSVDNDGKRNLEYEDRNKESLNMDKKTRKFVATADNGVANSIKTSGEPKAICRDKPLQEVLAQFANTFGNKAFPRHHAPGLEQFSVVADFGTQGEKILKTATPTLKDSVPFFASIIGSHTVYKVKTESDVSLMILARTAPHGNEDHQKHLLTKDSPMSPAVGVRMFGSIAFMYFWNLYNIDVKFAILQTGALNRKVYIKPVSRVI